MLPTAPAIVQSFIRAYHEQRNELFAQAKQLPGEMNLVSVFFEAEGYIVEACINRTDALGVHLMPTPLHEMEGPAVGYTITDFDDPREPYRPLTWN